MKKRTFRQLWDEIGKTGQLPGMAILDMPKVLTPETKSALGESGLTADDAAALLMHVIETIEMGSVERVDTLVRRSLRNIGVK